jgi:DNA-binding transcriptional ArsR family regulator
VFEITLRIDDEATAARIFTALADALGERGVSLVARARASEPDSAGIANAVSRAAARPAASERRPLGMEPVEENMIDEPEVVKAISTGKIMRLTDAMHEILTALADRGGEAHRGALASALPDRSNNSIGRSLAALGRGGMVEARFEGSDTFRLTPLGRATVEGRVKSRVDSSIRVADREPPSVPPPTSAPESNPESNSGPDGRATTWLSH